jgi:hypothetical protein
MSQVKDSQEKWKNSFLTTCSIQVFTDWMNLFTFGRIIFLLSLPTQIPVLSRNTLTTTYRILFNQISWHNIAESIWHKVSQHTVVLFYLFIYLVLGIKNSWPCLYHLSHTSSHFVHILVWRYGLSPFCPAHLKFVILLPLLPALLQLKVCATRPSTVVLLLLDFVAPTSFYVLLSKANLICSLIGDACYYYFFF